jgi:diguanylate cyclase (GGDEF)-like protein
VREAAPNEIARLERRVCELEERLTRLAALRRAAQAAASAGTVDVVLSELSREVGAVMPRAAEVCTMEWDRRRRVVRDVIDYRPRTARRVALPEVATYRLADLPELENLLRRGAGHLMSLREDPRTPQAQRAYMCRWNWKTLLQLPLVTGGRTIGVLEVVDIERQQPFADEDIEFCETVAAQAAHALQSAQLFERIRHLADHDALTGLANPRTFRRRVGGAVRGARATGRSVAVLVIDLDDFKALNDRRGHAFGDRVLCRGAAVLRRVSRVGDCPGRLGGDELALLACDADAGAATVLGERIRRELAQESVSVSIGIAASSCGAVRGADLIHQADMALLSAKALGKNAVCLAAA